jgi:hypothetical protein
MVGYSVIGNLNKTQSDLVDAFKMECSLSDIKTNKEAKKLANYINRHGKKTDRVCKLINKL